MDIGKIISKRMPIFVTVFVAFVLFSGLIPYSYVGIDPYDIKQKITDGKLYVSVYHSSCGYCPWDIIYDEWVVIPEDIEGIRDKQEIIIEDAKKAVQKDKLLTDMLTQEIIFD